MDERDLLVGKHNPESESNGLNGHSQGGCVPLNPCSLVGSLVDGRFCIEALLGIGGMACIYRAEQVYLKKLVALKILHPVFANSASSVERFQREAQIAVQLKSPHVVDVLDFGRTSDGRVFLAMELLKGETLYALIEREGRLTPARTVALLRQLLSGLQAAHEMGIVHRDIKPENIWLVPTPEGEQLKLLDFGIAKLLQPEENRNRTQIGMVIGTPEYIAPEQAMGDPVDSRADLYSVGILAFVLLSGKHPFPTKDVCQLMQAHVYSKIPALDAVCPELAAYPKLVRMVSWATEKKPASRSANAAELLRLLEGAEVAILSTKLISESVPLSRRELATGKTKTLAVLSLGIASAATRVSLTGEERKQASAKLDRLLAPVLFAFGGSRVGQEGVPWLAVFPSSTESVLCGMAMVDRITQINHKLSPENWLAVRVSICAGEVVFARGLAQGDPVEAAIALDKITPLGEVWMSESVSLSMHKTPVCVEPVTGTSTTNSTGRVFRVAPGWKVGVLPYGGAQLARLSQPLARLRGILGISHLGIAHLRKKIRPWVRRSTASRNRLIAGLASVSLLLLLGGMFFFLRPFLSPSVEDQAEKALQSGNPQGVLQVLAATESSAEASFLKARALMELHREKDALEHYETAFELAPNILEKAEVLADLSSLLGSAYTDKAQSLLIRAGDKSVDVLAQAASDTNSRLRRWSAIKALQTLNRSDRVDLGAAYIADLKSKDCSVLRNASRELGELGDKRAVLYLKEISQRTRFGIFDACETSAAREALNKISRK